MKKNLIKFLTCILLFFSFPTNSYSGMKIYMPRDVEKVEFHLLTVGLGSEIYTRYGHSILQMSDLENNQVYNFNWGVFDFIDSNFAWNFFKGIQIYRLGASYTPEIYEMYKDFEKRQVLREKINLTSRQKERLIEKIFQNLKYENQKYRYQHFYNNCSTKLRDILDYALNGKISKTFKKKISTKNFREYITENLNSPFFTGFFLDILMNELLDGKMNLWEEMFYPAKMRELLLTLENNNTTFLSESEVMIEGPNYPASSINLFSWIMWMTFFPLMLLGYFLLKNRVNEVSNNQIRLFGGILFCWAGFSGILGTIMVMAWVFSEHLDILHNANLWLFWPTDLLLSFYGFILLFTDRRFISPLAVKGFTLISGLHLFASFTVVVLWATGIIEQNISNSIIFLFPPASLLYSIGSILLNKSIGAKKQ